jgi:hypothetical protein
MMEALLWIVLGVSLLPAHRAAFTTRHAFAALLAVEAVAALMILLGWANPSGWSAVAQEDGIVEWATFAAFVLAAGWLLVRVRSLPVGDGASRALTWWFQGACVLLALFCLAVAGEEISWGQRLFGFKPPDVFLERNFQQEFNVHNVLMREGGLGFKIESKHLVMAIAVGFGLLWPALVRGDRFKRLSLFGPLSPPFALAPLAIGVVAFEIAYPVDLTGEGAELIVGLVFLASALIAAEPRRDRVIAWIAAPVVLGGALALFTGRLLYGSDEAGIATAKVELVALANDMAGGATERLSRRSIHKRVYTAVVDGYLHLTGKSYLEGKGTPAEPSGPPPRADRRGYFLDPWNNPYWIQVDKRGHIARVYSFGPNRRRDLSVRKRSGDLGDDLVVELTLESPLAAPPPAAPQSGSPSDDASTPTSPGTEP